MQRKTPFEQFQDDIFDQLRDKEWIAEDIRVQATVENFAKLAAEVGYSVDDLLKLNEKLGPPQMVKVVISKIQAARGTTTPSPPDSPK